MKQLYFLRRGGILLEWSASDQDCSALFCSLQCRDNLVRRQKMMQEDYKVNKGLAEMCKRDIKTYHCLRHADPETKLGKLAHVLLCLEGAQREGGWCVRRKKNAFIVHNLHDIED